MLALFTRCCSAMHGLFAQAVAAVALLVPALLVLPTAARASAPCSAGLTVEFRFHASAPIEDALLTQKGAIAVTSVDGYVHALGPNGRFLWSYTLDSAPVAIELGEDGRVYAASDAGSLHVLRANGERQWAGHLPAGMVPTGKMAHSDHGVVFVPSNLNLYAFSAGSGLLWRAFIGSTIVSGPAIGSDGDAWVIAQNGSVHRIKTPNRRSSFSISVDGSTTLVSASGEQVVVLDESGLTAHSLTGQTLWALPDVVQVTPDARVVRTAGSKWVWLSEKGEPQAERQLTFDVSAQPAHAQGLVYVPTTDGRLYVFGADGAVQWCQVAHAPLRSPRVHSKTGPVVVASGDGALASIYVRPHEGQR
jgi:outer membrane protein assembly factor BamB